MKTFTHITLAFAMGLLTALPVRAAEDGPRADMDIAAVVGEEAISSYDVENRIRFIIATTHLSNTSDIITRIRPQVLRALIDEKLQMQEAARNGITIPDRDVEEAVSVVENQRNMPAGSIYRMLDQNKIPREIFTSQLRAQLAWAKLISKKVRPSVKVGNEEIEMAKKRITAPTVKQEMQIEVLTLPIDKPSRAEEIKRLGDKLVREVRAGADFGEVARQFSHGSSSGKFTVRPEQLDPAMARALAGARVGTVTDPVRTEAGFTIVKVYTTRALEQPKAPEVEVDLKEILLRLKTDATPKEADVLLQIGEEVAKHPGTCEEKGVANISDLQDFDIDVNFRHDILSHLPPALKIIAENLKVGDISAPFASAEGIRLYMLCDKKEASLEPVDRERVANVLLQQKLELEAQKYMRNLRRDTFVDVR